MTANERLNSDNIVSKFLLSGVINPRGPSERQRMQDGDMLVSFRKPEHLISLTHILRCQTTDSWVPTDPEWTMDLRP